jgi:hypothetical protein
MGLENMSGGAEWDIKKCGIDGGDVVSMGGERAGVFVVKEDGVVKFEEFGRNGKEDVVMIGDG